MKAKIIFKIMPFALALSLGFPVSTMAADTNTLPVTTALTEDGLEKALLGDYDYTPGTFSAEAWNSDYLHMRYIVPEGYSISAKINDEMQTYYLRNGTENQIASSELVVLGPDGDYMQMIVEANPNAENAFEILNRFAETERLSISMISNYSGEERVSENHIMKQDIKGKEFSYCVGNIDGEPYLLAVHVNGSDPIVAIKVKSDSIDGREKILSGFQDYTETKNENEKDTVESQNEIRGTAVAKHLWELD